MNIEDFFKHIEKFAKYYIKILQADFANEEIKSLVSTINEGNMQETYPYLLEVLDDVESGRLTEETLIQLLNTVIAFINEQRSGNFQAQSTLQTLATKLIKEFN